MIYTHKSPALLLMGLLILLWGGLNRLGSVDDLQAYLQPSAYKDHIAVKEKWEAELRVATEQAKANNQAAPSLKKPLSKFDKEKEFQSQLCTIFGGSFTLIGLFTLFWRPKPGNVDYLISTVPGVAFIASIAFVVRWGLDPMFANWGKAVKDAGMLSWDFAKIFNLNYVVLGILAGIFVVNVIRVPAWAANGVRLSRLFLKSGVILLGTLYSAAELAQLGMLSVILIAIFVLGSVGIVLIMGRRMQAGNSMTGVLSAGMGVCGVSATVAASPVVQAKASEIAYTIGTILAWGVMCMFIFPTIGHLFEMTPVQFGAWAGTGILNSAQVAGAALAYDPEGVETLKVAEIFNITRVLFLPIIVLWLATWYVKNEENATKVDIGHVLISKFPLFVLGFILLFIMSSLGFFAPADHYQGKFFSGDKVKEEKLLKAKQGKLLEGVLQKMRTPEEQKALQDLIANRKLTSRDQDNILKAVAKIPDLDNAIKGILENAHKAAWHDSPVIRAYRDWIAWLFAFGLIGLGMQITGQAIKQAGGKPLVIGSVVGTLKAVGSLLVVLLFISKSV
ncbi:YeiH family protein [Candidatus Magnetaquicoccus inordinatus]|uniref:YeiH family protein n=1 Tax=Candidatus Magnetaquicoccus inordinatus TaxID=2496818 RepID=UPI00102AFB25|nr:putative sulfate exporter family transporter [Candidatus Magnetaquicoccus inordinatus]